MVVGVAALIVAGDDPRCRRALNSSGSASPKTLLSASSTSASVSGATITVTGNGQVEGTPDNATFQVGVDTNASSAVSP